MAWISATTPSSYKPRPNPADMITWVEVREMCDHPRTNPRDAAHLAVAWDAGLRSGELQELTIGNIYELEAGKQLRVDGKTGPREVAITIAVPYLQQWLNQHPARDDRTAPLWSKLKENEGISYRLFPNIFENAARRIDLEKPDTPTNSRKSGISDLASKGINQATLEDRHGWERGSKAAARYISVFSENRQQQVLEARGAEVEIEEPSPRAPSSASGVPSSSTGRPRSVTTAGPSRTPRRPSTPSGVSGGTSVSSSARSSVTRSRTPWRRRRPCPC